MNKLFSLVNNTVNGEAIQTVSARELHEFLEVGRDFSNWFKGRVAEYEFIENQDFVTFSPSLAKTPNGGRPRIEYHISLDMAKELSMVERNNKGREARAYFIDCERRAVAGAQAQPAPAPAELSRMDILRLALESEEAKIKAEAERDEAIRTKALIGSKREATAMATASAAKRETEKLREELGACARHATITAVQIATGTEYKFAPMRRWCAANGATPVDVPDKRYGKVKAWPAAAWAICHDVDLSALFGEVAA